MKHLILLASLLYTAPGHAAEYSHYLLPDGGKCLTVVLGMEEVPTDEFYKTLHRPSVVCLKKYGTRSTCLDRFEQVGPNDYKATCGGKR